MFLRMNGQLMFFNTVEELHKYGCQNNMRIAPNQELYDFDAADSWIVNKEVNCQSVLSVWNIVSDLCRTFHEEFLGDSKNPVINKIYDKLFFGNNLSALKGKGKKYSPPWSEQELLQMEGIISYGISMIRKRLE